MTLTVTKEVFLLSKENKQKCINMLGDTVSKIHGIGKGNIRKIEANIQLSRVASVFDKPNATALEIENAGENLFLAIYNSKSIETLDTLRYHRFQE